MKAENEPVKSYESFKATIDYLKRKMQEGKNDIGDSEIAQRLKIQMSTYYEYLENDTAPDEVFETLREEFKDVLKDTRIKRARTSFEIDLDDDDI